MLANQGNQKPNALRKPRFLAVDFFCGAGGTTRGLLDAGGYVVAGIDKDKRCKETYTENNFNETIDYCRVRFLECDIFPKSRNWPSGQQQQVFEHLDTLLPYYREKAPDTPLLFAICAPCQPFTSVSRKTMSAQRQNMRAKDRSLLLESCKFVARYKPDLILSENVAGIRDPKYGNVWEDFRAELESLGYVTGSKVVCTSRFGIPQYRKRSILAAIRGRGIRPLCSDLLGSEIIIPEHDQGANVVPVSKAIGHFPAIGPGETHPTVRNHSTRGLSELNQKRLAAAKPGHSNSYLFSTEHGDLSLACHVRVNRKMKSKCFNDVYTRMAPDKPSPTITTKCHSVTNGRFGHYDPKQIRGISLREAATLQSFGEDYVFYPEDQVEPVARMIGNAVPPKLAYFFAQYLVNAREGVLQAAGAR